MRMILGLFVVCAWTQCKIQWSLYVGTYIGKLNFLIVTNLTSIFSWPCLYRVIG